MLLLAIVMVVVGCYMVVSPFETNLFHFGTDDYGPGAHSYIEHVSRTGLRVYGVISIVLGGGIAALVLYQPRK